MTLQFITCTYCVIRAVLWVCSVAVCPRPPSAAERAFNGFVEITDAHHRQQWHEKFVNNEYVVGGNFGNDSNRIRRCVDACGF